MAGAWRRSGKWHESAAGDPTRRGGARLLRSPESAPVPTHVREHLDLSVRFGARLLPLDEFNMATINMNHYLCVTPDRCF